MNPVVTTLLVKASLIIGAAAGVNTLLRRTSSASRHLVWTIAVLGVLALPALSLTMPRLQIPVRVSANAPAPTETAPTFSNEARPASITESTALGLSDLSATADAAPTPISRNIAWPTIALAIYLAGVGLFALRLLVDRLMLRRIIRRSTEVADPDWISTMRACEERMGIDMPVRLLRSLDGTMPMTFGTLKPTIVVPAVADTWTADRRRAVLLHELAHIARRDCLTQMIAAVACALYWMHPGVWWMARRLRVERELACDDRVLRIGTQPRAYAEHLLELAYSLGGDRAPALVVSMARQGQLEGRMLAVLDAARNRATPALRTRAVAVLVAAVVVVPLAAAETFVVTDSPISVERLVSTQPADTTPAAEPQSRERDRDRAIQFPGTWEIRAGRGSDDDGKTVYLQLKERPNSNRGFSIDIAELQGLTMSAVRGSGGPVKFSLRREAGTIEFEGTIRSGVGGGTFTFTPSATFASDMAKRGYERPTADDQYRLAMGNIGATYLDELQSQRYAKPSLDSLVRAGDHGVSLEYLQGMGRAGYKLGELESLVRTRDHGVTPRYVTGLADAGYKGLTAEELVRARDHGVDVEYVSAMHGSGFNKLSIEELVRARDHGVDADFIHGMASLGFGKADIEDLVNARDHGVDHGYAKSMRDMGHDLTLHELVRTRDHGVTAEFAKAFRDLGYRDLSAEELVRLRDHGVTPAYARSQNDRERDRRRLSVEELVRRRDHGIR